MDQVSCSFSTHAQTGLSALPTSALSLLSELALGLGFESPLGCGAFTGRVL